MLYLKLMANIPPSFDPGFGVGGISSDEVFQVGVFGLGN